MENKNLKPELLWKNFKHICSIPHPSKHEEKITAWLLQWAKEHNISALQDSVGNIIFSKPATKGYENRKGVILQGHIDMVPQKNSDKVHDFTQDPIEIQIGDDGWVRANGTTLGADNGIGCAAAMSILESNDIAHGPLEVLVTVDEETGMTGAFGLKPDVLHGDILMNLDSEDEGELYVGCAGGLDASITFDYKQEPVPKGYATFELAVKALKGGHSGMDIDTGRANANKILFRCLKQIVQKYNVRISSIDGGSLRNAIPREAFATICIPSDKVDLLKEYVEKFFSVVKTELSLVEPDVCISLAEAKAETLIDEKTSMNLIDAVYGCPNGVIRMSDSVKGLVETSTNLAIVKSENGQISIACLLRSSVDTAKEDLAEMMGSIFCLAGAKCAFSGGYPGWKPNMKSEILQTMIKTYESLYKKTPLIKAIHAGLECGLLGGVYPNLDMISFGPTIRNPHSPDERVKIESVEKFWNFLVEALKNIPVK
jgi:dipeptidase D